MLFSLNLIAMTAVALVAALFAALCIVNVALND